MQFCSSLAYTAKILIERSNLVAKHITYKATHPCHNLEEYANARGEFKTKMHCGNVLILFDNFHACLIISDFIVVHHHRGICFYLVLISLPVGLAFEEFLSIELLRLPCEYSDCRLSHKTYMYFCQ